MGQTATKSGHGDYSAVAELNFCREVDLDGFMRHAMATASGEGPHDDALTELPKHVFVCLKLRTLRARFQMLRPLPGHIARLRMLQTLELSFCGLPELPEAIGELHALQDVDVRNNKLTTLPGSFSNLRQLRRLNLSSNSLPQVPDVVMHCQLLQRLNVSNNAIHTLPDALPYQLPQVAVLVIHPNPLREPLASACAKGTPAILRALRMAAVSPASSEEEGAAEAEEAAAAAAAAAVTATDAATSAAAALAEVRFGSGSSPDEEEGADMSDSLQSRPVGVSFASMASDPGLENRRMEVSDHVAGALVGQAMGDAVGLLTEFMSHDEARFYYNPPLTYDQCVRDRHRCSWQPGDWTDDTDQAILVLQALLAGDGIIDPKDLADRLLQWEAKGFPELGDTCGHGLGNTVGTVLTTVGFAEDPHKAARAVWEVRGRATAANGAVMRTAPVGLWSFEDLDTVTDNAKTACLVTHTDPRCVASCVAVSVAIASMLQRVQDAGARDIAAQACLVLDLAVERGRQVLSACEADGGPEHLAEWDKYMNARTFTALELAAPRGIGYTLKCAGAAFAGVRRACHLRRTVYRHLPAAAIRHVLTELVMEGGDSDTNAAVCGALLGACFGLRALEKAAPDWLDGLLHRAWLGKRVSEVQEALQLPARLSGLAS